MRVMLYYIPGYAKHSVDKRELAGLGLGHLAGMSLPAVKVNGGPDKGHGVLVMPLPQGSDTALHKKCGYKAAEQDWFAWKRAGEAPTPPTIWCGWYRGEQPGPQDLRRPERHAVNLPVELADGKVWEFTPAEELPRAFCLGDGGAVVSRFQQKYARFQEADDWLAEWMRDGSRSEPIREIIARLATLLGINYRVSALEVLALGLIDEINFEEVWMTAIGLRDLWVKKNDFIQEAITSPNENLASCSGGAAEILDTNPSDMTANAR